ncbi:MAG: MFS transporter [Actinobacteria bacterium]|nr:MFS transporter [Actinomycetota bacterium]MCG2802016.1 MFS transporter [Cellulomonas sp.]
MSAATARAPWLSVGATLFAVAWGGNEFTPLLVMYRTDGHMSALMVDLLLGAYVLGIVPGLLVGGPLSDRFGRRPLMLPAPVLGALGSAVLAAGAHAPAVLFLGRICSGIALGLVMAVGTSWIKELSDPSRDPGVDPGAGARRASLSLTAGFGLGAGVAAALAQWGPWHAQLPYLVNIALTIAAGVLLLGAPETRQRPAAPGRLVDDLRIPSAAHRRFLLVVAPTAPWVFGTAASAYAILPGLLAVRMPGVAIGLAGLMCLVALGCGVGVQVAARRLDTPNSARGVAVAIAVAIPGMVLAALTATTSSATLGLVAAAVLGSAYGLLLVGGLQEVQRIAGPDDLAGLTAVFYSLSYVGFFIPALLAGLHPYLGYPTLFGAGAVLALASLGVVLLGWRRHLPTTGSESAASAVRAMPGQPTA